MVHPAHAHSLELRIPRRVYVVHDDVGCQGSARSGLHVDDIALQQLQRVRESACGQIREWDQRAKRFSCTPDSGRNRCSAEVGRSVLIAPRVPIANFVQVTHFVVAWCSAHGGTKGAAKPPMEWIAPG
jgi:hypothetical protein